jgi:hypothetical protein
MEECNTIQIHQQFDSLQTGHVMPQAIVNVLTCVTQIHFNLQSIQETRQRLDTVLYNDFSDDKLCVICHETRPTQVFYPCRHLAACATCTNTYIQDKKTCPLCRKPITSIKNVIHFRDTEPLPPYINTEASNNMLPMRRRFKGRNAQMDECEFTHRYNL